MATIDMTLSGTTTRLVTRRGALRDLGGIVHDVASARSALLAYDAQVADSHRPIARASLEAQGFEVVEHELVASEKLKTLETIRVIYGTMLQARLERRSPVVALGGGIVGDTAGFAAATYLRGVPLVIAPTTLLSMVDASIGGKTGVNHPLPGGSLGKNLVGAFWQPRAIVADPATLATLEDRHFRCGLAECVKHGVLGDAELFAWIEAHASEILARDDTALDALIERSQRVKVGIVERDEREAGERALLNLGHTFGHAIEPIAALDLHHGEAVAIGMAAAARCAVEAELLDAGSADRIVALLEAVSLPTRLPRPVAMDDLMHAMAFDKKVSGGRVRLVLPTSVGRATLTDAASHDAVAASWRAVGASAP